MKKRKKVSFDFDGVLHGSVHNGTLHPVCFYEVDCWKPRLDIHELLREEAEEHDVYIVTSRMEFNKPEIMEFVFKYNLPIKGIICGNDNPKAPILAKLGSIRHYDDDHSLEEYLSKLNIEFIYSKPPYFDIEDYHGGIRY